MEEKTIQTTEIFHGKVLHVTVDEVELPNGNTSLRELIHHPGGVCVLAMDEQENVLLVRQYRKAVEEALLEIPAGKREPGEDPMLGAARELEEETGFRAKELIPLGHFIPTPGYCDERIYIYLARELMPGTLHPDEDEFVQVEKYPLEELLSMVEKGELTDGKTAIALMKYMLFIKNKGL